MPTGAAGRFDLSGVRVNDCQYQTEIDQRLVRPMAGLLWLVLVVVVALLLANFVNAAVGGIVGLILAVLVFLLVIREADHVA